MTERARPSRWRRPRVPAPVRRRWPRSQPSARSDGHSGRAEHRSVYSRSYLPHFDAARVVQGITFRLADSVPRGVINSWREEILMARQWRTDRARHEELQRRVARYEDAGRGECHLGRAEIAATVRDALARFDGEWYQLLAWCVMPNHVHVLIKQRHGFPLADVVRSWKGSTARKANAILGRTGRFWMPEYHDRRIRDDAHLSRAILYIENNPVKAGLCERPEDWPWSSAKERAGR